MTHQKPFLAVSLVLCFVLLSCDSNEIGDSKDVNQDKIYLDYEIDYTQGDEYVTGSFQFRFAGSAGTTLVLNEPSRVELDGELLNIDSSEFAGAFYELRKKFTDFIGKHTISFTDANGKKLENTFDFAPFTLHGIPSSVSKNEDLVFYYNLRQMAATDYIEINSIGTDSSFHFTFTGPDNKIIIPAKELQRQQGKTLNLECTLYREMPLLQSTSEGGFLKITYRAKPVKIWFENGQIISYLKSNL